MPAAGRDDADEAARPRRGSVWADWAEDVAQPWPSLEVAAPWLGDLDLDVGLGEVGYDPLHAQLDLYLARDGADGADGAGGAEAPLPLGDVDPAPADDVAWRPGEESGVARSDADAVAAARAFRDVLGRFATGVCVITAMSDGTPVGMTAQSFTSLSLDPPLVLFAPARTSRTWPLMRRAGGFCVNMLAEDQSALSTSMATPGIDKFADVEWTPAADSGSPVLAGAAAHIDCRVHTVHEAGDHYIVIGRVLALEGAEAEPLLFHRGAYRRLEPR